MAKGKMIRTRMNPYLFSVVLFRDGGNGRGLCNLELRMLCSSAVRCLIKLNCSVLIDKEEHGSGSVFIKF